MSPALETVLLSVAAEAQDPLPLAGAGPGVNQHTLGFTPFHIGFFVNGRQNSGQCGFAQKPALVTNQPRKMVVTL